MTDFVTPPSFVDGEFAKAATFNQALGTNMSLGVHRLAYKAADTVRSSTVTPTDDPDLTFLVGPQELWYVNVYVKYKAATTTPDFRTRFAGPTDSHIFLGVFGLASNGFATYEDVMTAYPATTGLTTSSGFWYGENSDSISLTWRGLVYTFTSGTFRFQWAQVNSSADTVTVKTGSNITGLKVGTNPWPPVV